MINIVDSDVAEFHTSSEWELGFGQIVDELLRRKVVAVLILLVFVAGGTAYAFLAQPIYRVSAILIPADNSNSSFASRALGSLGGLASLAGADLGAGSGDAIEALAVMKSRRFTTDFIRDKELLPRLFPRAWDASRKQWIVPQSEIPTYARAYTHFDRRIRKLSEDKKTGIVTLTIDWSDRVEAVAWATELVSRVNEEMRSRAIAESTASLKRLEKQTSETTIVAVQSSLAQLIESEVRRKTLASVREDYVFRVIDPPAIPDADDPVFPRKGLVIMVSVALALLTIAFMVVVGALMRRGLVDE